MKGVRQELIRAMNDRLICQLLRAHGALSRVELAERADMSVPAALKIVDRLAAANMVHAVGSADVLRPGPRARLFALTHRGVVTGVYVGAAGISITHTDLAGQTITHHTAASDPHSPAEQLLRLTQNPRPGEPQVIVVGLPGPVDRDSGEMALDELLEWPPGLGRRLQLESGAVTVIFDDATRLRALAAQNSSRAAHRADFIWLELGEDIRLALVHDGTLRQGAHGTAGDLGSFWPGGPDATTLAKIVGAKHDDEFSWLTELGARTRSNAWDLLAAELGPWLGALAAFVDPERLLLAGPVPRLAGHPLLEALQRWFAANYPLTPPILELSDAGADSAVQGAEVLGWQALVEHLLGAQ